MVVRILSSVFFTQLGVKERYLGYLNYLGIPWNLKFLWAPILDGWGTKRAWQITLQALIGVLTCVIGGPSFIAATAPDPEPYLHAIAAIFIVMAFLSATNDVAIDGYYLEALPKRDEQALLSGYRVLAYRLAMVFCRSGIVGLVNWVSGRYMHGSPYYSWMVGFGVSGIVLIGLAIAHHLALPHVGTKVVVKDNLAHARKVFKEGFKSYLAQPKIGIILLFITLYKLGDEILFSMVTPFMLRELRISVGQYAWIGGIVGALGTIVGAMLGGWWIKRAGLRSALWPLTLLMNLNLWLYIWLSVAKPDPATGSGLFIIAAVHGVEQLAAGLGSAALLVFLLTTCSHQYRATHYAIGSAIMSIPGTLVGGQAGYILERIGYTNLYLIAFIAAIPGMLLIPFVPIRNEVE